MPSHTTKVTIRDVAEIDARASIKLRDAERRLALVLADGAKVQVIDQIWILGSEALVEQGPVRVVT